MASASDPGLRDQSALHEALAFAEELADAARLMAMRRACSPLQIVAKYDGSPVTIVDGDIAHVLGELTAERYPGHAIHLGSVDEAARTPTWVFDPIARTRGFPAGSELLATSIALVDGLRPVLAVVDLPVLRERWTGTAGATHFNGRPVWTSAQKRLSGARLYTTSRGAFSPEGRAAVEQLARVCTLRCFGGGCCAYGLLASGHCDLVVEEGLQPKDYMAPACVVEGAGGIVTDWTGAPLGLHSDGRVVAAATRQLHREALQILKCAVPARHCA